MSASNQELVVDHVSDQFSAKEPIFFLSFLFEFWMILFWADAILASSISKFGKWIQPRIERDDFKSSTESTIFNSLIHNIASEGESEQIVTWFLNVIFQQKMMMD